MAITPHVARILVVEDEKYIRSVIAKRLGAYGRVDEAGGRRRSSFRA